MKKPRALSFLTTVILVNVAFVVTPFALPFQGTVAEARTKKKKRVVRPRPDQLMNASFWTKYKKPAPISVDLPEKHMPEGQREILLALDEGKGLDFVEIKGAEVVRLLPDDNEGRRHQKWIFEIAGGHRITAIYNTSFSEAVPLEIGDIVNVGGQYIFDKNGGVIHWLHVDPKKNRPDGYVELNGKRYGEFNPEFSEE